MRITIAERYRPFSHQPGTKCVLPGTQLVLEVFPVLVKVYKNSQLLEERQFNQQGPVKDFTVVQDLEKMRVQVFGWCGEVFFRYSIIADGVDGFLIIEDKDKLPPVLPLKRERLSLGMQKQLDWELVRRRNNLQEIMPVWLMLGQMTPSVESTLQGTASLLKDVSQSIEDKQVEVAYQKFQSLFLAGFQGMLAPCLEDAFFQGISYEPVTNPHQINPLVILTEGARLIRRLFVQEDKSSLHFLPAVPREFHCGRFCDVLFRLGTVDFEWRSRKLRRIVCHCNITGEIAISFPDHLNTCRLQVEGQRKRIRIAKGQRLQLEMGQTYYIDRFE